MRRALAVIASLVATLAWAIPFPPCNSNFINEAWRDPTSTDTYYCDGKNWQVVFSQGGDKAWTGDAGFAGNVNFGSSTTVSTFGACIAYGANPSNCWRSSFNGDLFARTADGIAAGGSVYTGGDFVINGSGSLYNLLGGSLNLLGTRTGSSPNSDVTITPSVARTAGQILEIDQFGASQLFGITYDGQLLSSYVSSPASFVDNTALSGHVALTVHDGFYLTAAGALPLCGDLTSNAPCSYGEPYGGIHGAMTVTNTHAQDAGFVFQASQFFVDFRGADVQGALGQSVLSAFDSCPQVSMPFDGGLPYGQQYNGEFESAHRWAHDKQNYFDCVVPDGAGSDAGWAAEVRARPGPNEWRGQCTLNGGGSCTATVNTSSFCVCSDSVNASVGCAVVSTTLTITGTAGHTITWHCL